jgi:hypothetical protein
MEAQVPPLVHGAQSAPAPHTDAADHTATLLAALGGLVTIAVNAALVLGVRRGLPGEPGLVALTIAYATLIVACATGIEILVADALRRALAQVIALIAFLVLPIVSFGAVQWLLALLVAVAAWLAVTRARRITLTVQPLLIVVLGTTLCTVIAVVLYGLAGFQHRELQAHFLMPEYGQLGLLHKDPLMFVSFASEIMSGRWPGSALDGIRPMFYHFGVPLLLASFARATGASAFHTYMAGQQLLFIPLIVFYAGLAASALATNVGAPVRAGALAVVLCVATVLAVPHLSWPVLYYSESSAASMPLALLLLPLTVAWFATPDRAGTPGAIACVAALALTVALFKFSTAMTVGLWIGYLVLRSRLSERASAILAFVALVIGLVTAVAVWPMLFGHPFVTGETDANTIQQVRDEAAWALAFMALTLALQGACRAAGCNLVGANAVLRVLLVLVPFTAAGAWLVGVVQHVYDSRYLFNNLTVLTLPLLAVSAAVVLDAAVVWLARRRPVIATAMVLALGLAIVTITAYGLDGSRAAPVRSVESIDAALHGLCPHVPGDACRSMRAFGGIAPEVVAALPHATGPRILAVLKQAPASDAFFVPPDNATYWRFALSGKRPIEALNFLPAHFGVPLLFGLPPASYGASLPAINLGLMGRYDDGARARPMGDDALCAHARTRNVARVVVFAALEPPDVRLLACR